MEQADVADFLNALGQDMWEEPADKFENVKVGGAEAGTAHFPIGERDRVVLETHDAVVGDGALEDVGGEGGEGGVAVVVGLTVDIPGESPDLGGDVLQQAGLAHVFFEEGSGDGGERFPGHREVGSGGKPRVTVFGETATGDDVMDMRVVVELPTPGMQDASKTRELCPAKTLVFGQPFEGERRGGEQGVVREAVMRAHKGTQGLRDGEGEEDVRPRELCVEVVL
jgi:hypothetical protein